MSRGLDLAWTANGCTSKDLCALHQSGVEWLQKINSTCSLLLCARTPILSFSPSTHMWKIKQYSAILHPPPLHTQPLRTCSHCHKVTSSVSFLWFDQSLFWLWVVSMRITASVLGKRNLPPWFSSCQLFFHANKLINSDTFKYWSSSVRILTSKSLDGSFIPPFVWKDRKTGSTVYLTYSCGGFPLGALQSWRLSASKAVSLLLSI